MRLFKEGKLFDCFTIDKPTLPLSLNKLSFTSTMRYIFPQKTHQIRMYKKSTLGAAWKTKRRTNDKYELKLPSLATGFPPVYGTQLIRTMHCFN